MTMTQFKNQFGKLIEENNPTIKINGRESKNVYAYIYNNYVVLQSSYYSERTNTLTLDFISSYQLKKITGECGC